MEIVNANTVIFNVYYLIGEYQSKNENYGDLFYFLSSNLPKFFNLVKPVTEMATDNYLSEHCCSSQDVSKTRKKITNELFACFMKVASKLFNYLNIVLSGEAF